MVNSHINLLLWIAISILQCSYSSPPEFSGVLKNTGRVFKKLTNPFDIHNMQEGRFLENESNFKLPGIKTIAIPSIESSELTLMKDSPLEYDERNSERRKNRKKKNLVPNVIGKIFVNPEYENSDDLSQEVTPSREEEEKLQEFDRLKYLLRRKNKGFRKHFISQKGLPRKTFPQSIKQENVKKKHYNHSTAYDPQRHSTGDRSIGETTSTNFPRIPLVKLPLYIPVTRIPNSDNILVTKWKILRNPQEDDVKNSLDVYNNNYTSSPKSANEESDTMNYLEKQKIPSIHPDKRRSSKKNSNTVKLDFSKSNRTDVYNVLFKVLQQLRAAGPDSRKRKELELIVKPPENSNTTFIQFFMNSLKAITTDLIPDAIIGVKLTGFRMKNDSLLIFQTTLYVKYLTKKYDIKLPDLNYWSQFTTNLNNSKLNENDSLIIDIAENETVAEINLNQNILSDENILRSTLVELFGNSTRQHGQNDSAIIISIFLPNHTSHELKLSILKTTQLVMCELVPSLSSLVHLRLSNGNATNDLRTEVQILIQENKSIENLKLFNLTHAYENRYQEISKKIPQLVYELTKCQNKNSTTKFNVTMILPKHVSDHSIKQILRAITNILREFVPQHRILIAVQTSNMNNSLVLELDITLQPSELLKNLKYHNSTEKEISINLQKPGSRTTQKLRKVLTSIIREIEGSSEPVSLIFNMSFPLGVNKNLIRSEICLLITRLEDYIPIKYGSIASIILQITIVPANLIRNNEVMGSQRFQKYLENLQKATTESFVSWKYNPKKAKYYLPRKEETLQPTTKGSLLIKLHYEYPLRVSVPPSFRRRPEMIVKPHELLSHKFQMNFTSTNDTLAAFREDQNNLEEISNQTLKHILPYTSAMNQNSELKIFPRGSHKQKSFKLRENQSTEEAIGLLKSLYDYLKNKDGKLERLGYSLRKKARRNVHTPTVNNKKYFQFKFGWPNKSRSIQSRIFKSEKSSVTTPNVVKIINKLEEISTTPALNTQSIELLRNMKAPVSQLASQSSFIKESNQSPNKFQTRHYHYHEKRMKAPPKSLRKGKHLISEPIFEHSNISLLQINNETNNLKEIYSFFTTTRSREKPGNRNYTLIEQTTVREEYSKVTEKGTTMETSFSSSSMTRNQTSPYEPSEQETSERALLQQNVSNEKFLELSKNSTSTETEINSSSEKPKFTALYSEATHFTIATNSRTNETKEEPAIVLKPELNKSKTKYPLQLHSTGITKEINERSKETASLPISEMEIYRKIASQQNNEPGIFPRPITGYYENNEEMKETTISPSNKMEAPNTFKGLSRKFILVKNQWPTFTSSPTKGEIIDKESSVQYYKNINNLRFHKRVLNFSRLKSKFTYKIEKSILYELRSITFNDNGPKVLILKILPPKGMMVSQLRTLTDSLLPFLISNLPNSEISIETKAYYNENHEIKLMKMKVTLSVPISDAKERNNEMLENKKLRKNNVFMRYLNAIIIAILEQIDRNFSGQQTMQFNFTINSPEEEGVDFLSNLMKSMESLLSKLLPYANVDITANTNSNPSIISTLVNLTIGSSSNSHKVTKAPVIHLDDLSLTEFQHEISNFVSKILLNNARSDKNISLVIDFSFITSEITSFDIIELENTISEILDKMQISEKLLSMDAHLVLNEKGSIIIHMPFLITATEKSITSYVNNSNRNNDKRNRTILPLETVSDFILEDK